MLELLFDFGIEMCEEEMMLASELGCLEIIQHLIETMFISAASGRQDELIKYLIEKGVDINAVGDEAICVAAENGRFTKFLIRTRIISCDFFF